MFTFTCLAFLCVTSPQTIQEGSAALSTIRFADPIRVLAGGEPIGGLYPSPRLYDIDRDGQAELVIGDLPGNIKFAEKVPGTSLGTWGELQAFQTGDRKLKFNNW